VFALGLVKRLLPLGDFLADGLQLLGGFFGRLEGFCVALVRKRGPRLKLIRILARVRHRGVRVPRALRGDALGRADALGQGRQREPELLRLFSLRLQLVLAGL